GSILSRIRWIAAGPERNQVRITSHEAHIAAILHDLNDVAGEKYMRIESLRSIHHRRLIMRTRDRDGADTAARVELGSGPAVEKRNAIPEQISSVRLQEQSALA